MATENWILKEYFECKDGLISDVLGFYPTKTEALGKAMQMGKDILVDGYEVRGFSVFDDYISLEYKNSNGLIKLCIEEP